MTHGAFTPDMVGRPSVVAWKGGIFGLWMEQADGTWKLAEAYALRDVWPIPDDPKLTLTTTIAAFTSTPQVTLARSDEIG